MVMEAAFFSKKPGEKVLYNSPDGVKTGRVWAERAMGMLGKVCGDSCLGKGAALLI